MHNSNDQNLLNDYDAYTLLSYPRSGNTWLRYCIEAISEKPTGSVRGPIGRLVDLNVDLSATPVLNKTHILNKNAGSTSTGLILLVRNYKECIKGYYDSLVINNKINCTLYDFFVKSMDHPHGFNYMKNIIDFDNYDGEKLLIYYEDLILNPYFELSRVLKFINIEQKNLSLFVENIVEHQNRSLQIYGTMQPPSFTNGQKSKLTWHSLRMQKNILQKMDNHVTSKYHDVFIKYLHRYKESSKEVVNDL